MRPDRLSGTPRAHPIDRWIYVFTAASFITIVLAGFIPSSLAKLAAVEAGQRPSFPMIMHLHALLMGSFLLLLLAQTVLVATGRCALHMKLGIASLVIAPALVVVGFLLAAGNHQAVWGAALNGPTQVRAQMQELGMFLDNVLLLQIRIGILFPVLLVIGLLARSQDPGMHKRMMILAVAATLPAGIDRIPWLPTTLPDSPLASDLYTLAAIAPMLLWDLRRNRRLHRAYWILLGLAVPVSIAVHMLWDTPQWHVMARNLTGA
ncbi:hypothetical protein FMM02_04530 [Sphingomonas xanthus]|uniref:DUF2306 domain-containing protein n=2 Tax=Sphingomonas xanthus TaxID=2594473 RepID=A0A516IU95_9SPHN|nr:hypothetical protein FMM02_04530 [Sphingomonas xanthus]